jgi:hypothetical protein
MGATRPAKKAMEEFGFKAVNLDEPGAPTPGRIADRLSDIHSLLVEGIQQGEADKIAEATIQLATLLLALDGYDAEMLDKYRE